MDPDKFENPPKRNNPDKNDDHNGLYEVLDKVSKRLNSFISNKK